MGICACPTGRTHRCRPSSISARRCSRTTRAKPCRSPSAPAPISPCSSSAIRLRQTSPAPRSRPIVAHRISATGALTDAVTARAAATGHRAHGAGRDVAAPVRCLRRRRLPVIYYGGPATSSSTYIEGRFVAPDATLGTPFRISPDFSYTAITPRVVFDGTNFIVADGDATGWKLARVTPAGIGARCNRCRRAGSCRPHPHGGERQRRARRLDHERRARPCAPLRARPHGARWRADQRGRHGRHTVGGDGRFLRW